MTVHGGRRRLGIARASAATIVRWSLTVCSCTVRRAPVRRRLARPSARIDSMKRPRIAFPAATRIASCSSRSVSMNASASPITAARGRRTRRAASSVPSSIRSAASAAIAGSTTLRASNSWSDACSLKREHEAQVPHEQVGLERGHVGAGAVPHLGHAEHGQRAQRLAQRRPAHAHRGGQVALGRQPVAGAEMALLDQVEQARDDLLRHRLPRDGAERGWSDHPSTVPPRGVDPLTEALL